MSLIAYYEATIQDFLEDSEDAIFGALSKHHSFDLQHQQKHAWQRQIQIMRDILPPELVGWIYFEFSIPRMGKRADIVLLTSGVVFVIEFKVGSHKIDNYAVEQVHDYALDLKNFHRGSHNLSIVPILISTDLPYLPDQPAIKWAADQVAEPIRLLSISLLPKAIEIAVKQCSASPINPTVWSTSGYQPTPTIVEAALALYRQHDVKEITRSEAGADNLGRTAGRVQRVIEHAKKNNRKAICFITGVPGAGKTLTGLNIATSHAKSHPDEHAVFLSGNGPLVYVLREALARDKAKREGIGKNVLTGKFQLSYRIFIISATRL